MVMCRAQQFGMSASALKTVSVLLKKNIINRLVQIIAPLWLLLYFGNRSFFKCQESSQLISSPSRELVVRNVAKRPLCLAARRPNSENHAAVLGLSQTGRARKVCVFLSFECDYWCRITLWFSLHAPPLGGPNNQAASLLSAAVRTIKLTASGGKTIGRMSERERSRLRLLLSAKPWDRLINEGFRGRLITQWCWVQMLNANHSR